MVNYIESCLLCIRLCGALYDEMGAEHIWLVFHLDIHWQWQEKILVFAWSLILLKLAIALYLEFAKILTIKKKSAI